MTCALKNQYENLPDWLGKYVGMKKKLGGVYNFSSLYGLLCFWVIYALKRRRADSRDLIKKVYFAMKIQISRLSARCPLMVCIGNNDKWPAPIWGKKWKCIKICMKSRRYDRENLLGLINPPDLSCIGGRGGGYTNTGRGLFVFAWILLDVA